MRISFVTLFETHHDLCHCKCNHQHVVRLALILGVSFDLCGTLRRSKVSLNTLANDQTFRLLDRALQQGVNLKEV